MRLTKGQLKRIIREEYSRLKRQGLIKESRGNKRRYARRRPTNEAFGPIAGDQAYEEAKTLIHDFAAPETISFIAQCDKGIELLGKWHGGDFPDEVGYDLDEYFEYCEMDLGIDEKTAAQALVNVIMDGDY